MAYLHEARMMDAVKKLYIMGKKPKKKGSDLADSKNMSSFAAAAAARLKQKKPNGGVTMGFKTMDDAQNQDPMAKEMRSLTGPTIDSSEIRSAAGEPQQNWAEINRYTGQRQNNVMRDVDRAIALQDDNKFIEEMPMGGKYTQQGLQTASQNAMLNAEDRMKMRAMIGMGMAGSTVPAAQPQNPLIQKADSQIDSYKKSLDAGPTLKVPQ